MNILRAVSLKIFFIGIIIGLIFTFTSSFQSCKKSVTAPPDTMRVYKPNIYIYPKQEMNLDVKISFPQGGKIINSIPEYNGGWNVNVDDKGKIESKYDYLFYESDQPNIWQYKSGWVIEKAKLSQFFNSNMAAYGFNQKEINDFVEYWIPRLKTFKFYKIYPQEKKWIDEVIQIDYSTKPDNLLRLFYVIEGTDDIVSIGLHTSIAKFNRTDFYITEWGVILK